MISPIYSFGLPIPVKNFINDLEGFADKKYYCLLHYGGFAGNAVHFTQQLFLKNNLPIQAVYKMKMPENFTIFATVPKFYIKKLLNKKENQVRKIAEQIQNNHRCVKNKNLFAFADKIHNENSLKWNKFAEGFIVSENCDRCGYCERICPTKNITIKEGAPQFGNNCVACLGCYHRCPLKAINYGEKTINRIRYKNPNVDFSKMK